MKLLKEKNSLIIFGFVSVIFLLTANAFGQVYTPVKGSPERKAVLDGVRKYRKASQEVYSPRTFKVEKGWAYVAADDPNEPDVDTAAFDVILHKTGKNWKVVDEVSHVEGTSYEREIKRIRKKFPSAPAGIF